MAGSILPLVSIGIPTYNRADSYLKGALTSALSQTYPNIEIIVSDNASGDSTETLVGSFNDPRIKYYKQSRNIGGLNNANFCVQQANGDYFLLLHDDDLIDSDFVEVSMAAVDYNTDVGIILTGTRLIDEAGTVIREDTNKVGGCSIRDFILGWFHYKVPLYMCSTLYNTKRLKEMGSFRSRKNLYEDGVALFQLAAKFGRKDITDVKAGFRRHSANSGSIVSISDWCEDSNYLLDILCDLVPDDKEMIRREGIQYFCTQNYIRATRFPSPLKRLYSYFVVYKSFNYSYTLIHQVIGRNILYRNVYRALSSLKRNVGKMLLRGSTD